MAKLQCTKCNYKFDKDKVPLRCPYCGKENAVKRQLSAQDILNQVVADDEMIKDSRKDRYK